jgi:hypothetical protein
VNIVSRLLAALCLAALLALAPVSVALVHGGGSGGVSDRGATFLSKEVIVHVTDQLSTQTQAAIFPRRDRAFSLTHRVLAGTPREGGEAAPHELASLRLSQRVDLVGQQDHAFKRLAPSPLWADLLLEARVAPVSMLQLSTTAAYNPAETRLARANAELRVQPFTCWTFSLAPDFGNGSQLERLNGGMQLTLPTVWSLSYAASSHALDAAAVSHTLTTRYRSSYGHVRLELAQGPEERRVGFLIDVATFLHRRLGF